MILRNTKIRWFLGAVTVLILFAFQEPRLKKRITDKEFKYEFYVTDKEPGIKSDRIYYWFKGGAIHNSENGIAGELLHDAFDKFYLNNQLAEKGQFESGLKVGKWRTWYPNGTLETTQTWSNGRRQGMFYRYTENAALIEKGRYSTGKKQGQWINFVLKDTVTYDNGEKVVKVISEEDLAREAKRKENKALRKQKREEKKAEKEKEKQYEKDKSTINSAAVKPKETVKKGTGKSNSSNTKQAPKAKRESFFKRLFSKKEKPDAKGA